MDYFELSFANKQWNEDFCYVNKDFGFVLDGASSLVEQKLSDMESDAKWYSTTIGNYLIKNLNDFSKNIIEIIENAIEHTTNEYKKLAKNEKILDFPSCAAAVFRINNKKIEFYTIYDSIIIVEDVYGRVFDIYDSRNAINDNIVLSYASEKAKKDGLTMKGVRKKYPDIILQGRQLRNTFGHQFVLADNVDAVKNGICFDIDKYLISKIIVLSDGFSQCFDMFKFITMEKFIKKINCKNDAEKMYQKLRKHQKKDPEGQKYLRYKEKDDATIVYMKR